MADFLKIAEIKNQESKIFKFPRVQYLLKYCLIHPNNSVMSSKL